MQNSFNSNIHQTNSKLRIERVEIKLKNSKTSNSHLRTHQSGSGPML